MLDACLGSHASAAGRKKTVRFGRLVHWSGRPNDLYSFNSLPSSAAKVALVSWSLQIGFLAAVSQVVVL